MITGIFGEEFLLDNHIRWINSFLPDIENRLVKKGLRSIVTGDYPGTEEVVRNHFRSYHKTVIKKDERSPIFGALTFLAPHEFAGKYCDNLIVFYTEGVNNRLKDIVRFCDIVLYVNLTTGRETWKK